MKILSVACAVIFFVSTLFGAQSLRADGLQVRATVAELGPLFTRVVAGVRLIFAPGTVHGVWPDYGYRLDQLRKAPVCSDDAFIAQTSRYTLGYAAVIRPGPDDGYSGFTLAPRRHQQAYPP